MASGPPPKDGEVVTSSTRIRQILKRLEEVEKELHELLEDAGY